MRGDQLGPDQHRQGPAHEEQDHHEDEVLRADDLVVGAELEVALPALAHASGVELVFSVLVLAGDPAEDGIEGADPDVEADDPGSQGHGHDHVRAPVGALQCGVADQPAEEPDEDAGDQARDEVLVAVEATCLRAQLGVLEQRCGDGHVLPSLLRTECVRLD